MKATVKDVFEFLTGMVAMGSLVLGVSAVAWNLGGGETTTSAMENWLLLIAGWALLRTVIAGSAP